MDAYTTHDNAPPLGSRVVQSAANAPGAQVTAWKSETTPPIGYASTYFSRFGRPNPLFATAWPFDDDAGILEPNIALGIVTGPLLCKSHVHFTQENKTVGSDKNSDDCRKLQTSTNSVSSCKDASEQVQKSTLLEFGNPPSALEKKPFPFNLPANKFKDAQDLDICDISPEPVLKKAKLSKAPVPSATSTKTGVFKSAPRATTLKMNRQGQSQTRRLKKPLEKVKTEAVEQKPTEKVKTEPKDHEMEDVLYADRAARDTVQSPASILGANDKSFALNQVSSEENPASAYAGLKRAGKRSNRAVNPNVTQDQGQDQEQQEAGQRRNSRTSERPYAPKAYARNHGKPKGTHRIELKTRSTHYAAEVYQQFASMPDVTKDYSRSDEELLKAIKPLVETCNDAFKHGEHPEESLAELRERLHRMQFFGFLSKRLIERTRLFEEFSLGAMLKLKDNPFPYDIQGDAHMIAKQVFDYGCDPHLLRGIKTTTDEGKSKKYGFEDDYPSRAQANYVGPGKLINGQWWPLRVCAMRDGAHGAMEAGIHGGTGKGAYSIIVGGDSGYQDFDNGDEIQYCGTSSDKKDAYGNSVPTANTSRMLESCDDVHNEIRVFRAAAASGKHTTYSPSCGIRFDGMYVVDGKEHLDANTSMYRFRLVRVPGQDPIRYRGPEKRPTKYEENAFHLLKMT
ncbi:MAG: hypothetical protein Q9168_004393 [Polycauliona sp. 1 TL-2023]